MASAPHPAEARFLASRAARQRQQQERRVQQQQRQQQQPLGTEDGENDPESSSRGQAEVWHDRVQSWQRRLETVSSLYNNDPEKNERPPKKGSDHYPDPLSLPLQISLQQQLDELDQELQQLRKTCLEDMMLMMEPTGLHSDDDPTWEKPHPGPRPNLPFFRRFGDEQWSRAHAELVHCQEELHRIRDRLLPRRKFVFSRYRQALLKQQQQQQQQQQQNQETDLISLSVIQTEPTNKDFAATPSFNADSSVPMDQGVLENLQHVEMMVHEDGSVTIQSLRNTTDPFCSPPSERRLTTGSALVIRQLEHSQVSIYGTLAALYLVHIRQCTVEMMAPIQGAVHVTDCHHTTVQLGRSVQQVRLHDSSHLTMYLHQTVAPAILEKCRQVVFFSAQPDELRNGVRDFSWLRSGIASPNFAVERFEDLGEDGSQVDVEKNEGVNRTSLSNTAANPPVLERFPCNDSPENGRAANPIPLAQKSEIQVADEDDEL